MMNALSQQRILLVDDEEDHLMVFKATLELLHNATIVIAGNFNEALERLRTFQPTVIVTDLSMPQIDGYTLLARMRAREDTRYLPIIALTAHAMIGDRERILAAGFDGYITKPIDVSSLGAAIEACLNDFEARKARIESATATMQMNTTQNGQIHATR